jgi:predicted nucleic acid-binding protein
VILVDTSGLLAALFPDQRAHDACAHVLREAAGPFVLSPFVLAELDYLLCKLAGVETELDFLAEVAGGAYELAAFSAADVREARAVVDQFRALGIGLADASLVVLSRRFEAGDILTLDQRHFRALTGYRDKPFRLFPADADV